MFHFKRYFQFMWQRWTRGFDDSETWSLDCTLAKWVIPRLKRFKELNQGVPCDFCKSVNLFSDEDHGTDLAAWNAEIDKMIAAFELVIAVDDDKEEYVPIVNESGVLVFNPPTKVQVNEYRKKEKAKEKKINEGLKSFAKYYSNLWW